MKWAAVFGITVMVAFMVLYEWPRMNPKQKKEKAAFMVLMAMGWLLGVHILGRISGNTQTATGVAALCRNFTFPNQPPNSPLYYRFSRS